MIFETRTGTRRRVLLIAGGALALAALGALAIVLASIVLPPRLVTSSIMVAPVAGATTVVEPLADAPEPTLAVPSTEPASRGARGGADPALGGPGFLHAAFLVQGDPLSVASVRSHLDRLQVVFPDWLRFADADGRIDVSIDPVIAARLRASKVKVLPRLANTNGSGVWFEDGLRQLFDDKDATDIFIDGLIAALRRAGVDGVDVDIESLHRADGDAYVAWLDKVADALHARGFLVVVDVPMNDDAYDYRSIGRIADAVVLMAYDQHFPGSAPGAIAGGDWVADGLQAAAADIPADKLIVGIGAYSYDWAEGSRDAQTLTFDAAMDLARRVHADIQTDPSETNSRFVYKDEDGKRHQVWLLDAISGWNSYLRARRMRARGVSLWLPGYEDPALWRFYGLAGIGDFQTDALESVPAPATVAMSGEGEMLRVVDAAHEGHRDLEVQDGAIVWGHYADLPRPFSVMRSGRSLKKRVAFTFDDGPDPRWTPLVLNELEKNGVRATFFVTGDQAERYPQLLSQIYSSGNLVGNHTFLHRDLQSTSPGRLGLELNATQRLIEAQTGHSTVLFRPPYDTDSEPRDTGQLAPLARVDAMGYLVAAADVDSIDYARPGTERIVQNVLAGLARSHGNVVVFHDAGGDRSQTVAALGRLIPALRRQGYEIVGLDQLLNVDRDGLMPRETDAERLLGLGARLIAWGFNTGAAIVIALFGATTLISIGRIVFLGVLVLRRRRPSPPGPEAAFEPMIHVVIPAFNEAAVIARTLQAVVASDYVRLRVTVVDDGSSDETAAIVAALALSEPRLHLIRQPNLGKAAALNLGFRLASEEIVVTLDADTLVLPHTIRKLVEPFADPAVDAVCGNVQVGNVRNILTAFQSVEYVTSQNYDRRAFDALNGIAVVPGATGAWRRAAVLAVGGYSNETLTEDADLTLSVLGHGGRITYAPLAQSVTEAPERLAPLFHQRFRWSFGTLQCLWKHRRHFGHGALGRATLPNMVMFQFVFPLLAPLGDLILCICVVRGDLTPVAIGYATFLAMDVVAAFVAFRLDRRDLAEAWVILIQRFFYRQLLYVVTLAAVAAALRGRRHGWNKLQRTGTVRVAVPVGHAV